MTPATLRWDMSLAERLAVHHILQQHRQDQGLEIGTFKGGSLEAACHYLQHVTSLDIVPEHHQALQGRFPNATLVTGNSADTLPPLLQKLGDQLGYILIDGAHNYKGVKADLNSLLSLQPSRTLHVLCHDSFNPDVRMAMLHTRWQDNPHVHQVDLDFVPGIILQGGSRWGQMWGGFGAHYPPTASAA